MDIVERQLLEQLEKAIGETIPTTTRGEGAIGEKEGAGSTMLTRSKIREECKGLKERFRVIMDGGSVDERIKENLYYLLNVMTEWRRLSGETNFAQVPILRKLSGILKEVKKVVEDLEKEKKEKEKEEKEDSELRSSCSVDLKKIYGIEDHERVMERLLLKEGSFKAIGIVGMAGIGKTTLCQKVFHNEQVKSHFLPRIWVCLSKQSHVKDYKEESVKMILTGLGFEQKIVDKIGEGQDGLKRLLLALRLQLKRQTYLIVLDDAWNMEKDFMTSLAQDDDKTPEDRLHYGLPKGHGGAVIVTGRSRDVIAKMVGEKNLHSMPLADEDTCWKIFKDAALVEGKIKGQPDTAEEGADVFERETAKKCAGLPLTAKILGQVQHDK